jgi:phosphate transport system substrate-binding protein
MKPMIEKNENQPSAIKGGRKMKRTSIYAIIVIAACLICWHILPGSTVQAKEVLRYTGSNQVYHAYDKEMISEFIKETGIEVDVTTASSGAAVYRLMNGYSDIASTARELYRRHEDYGFSQIAFCKDPLAIITKAGCGVESLTEDQLQDIFSGEISNWKEVGGSDLPILVIVPSTETAANKNFRRQVMKHTEIDYDFMTYDSTMAIEAIKYFPCGAISFIAQGAVEHEKGIVTLKVNGLYPHDPAYPYFQIFYYVTKGKPSGAVKSFIDFSLSDKGLNIMKKNGMVPLSQ